MPPQCEFDAPVESPAVLLKDKRAAEMKADPTLLKDKIFNIRRVIRSEDRRIRAQHPWLAYQDTLGMGIFLTCMVGQFVTGWLYFNAYFGVAATVLSMAFLTGILHELEHDLIHDLYFKKSVLVQDIMFFGIWISKLHANPWWRRTIHLRHHNHSGDKLDIEERLIGLGLPFGWARLMVCVNPFASLFVAGDIKKDNPHFNPVEMILFAMPPAFIYLILSICLLAQSTGLWDLVFPGLVAISPAWKQFTYDWGIVICLPNIIRQACLQCISSFCHYYEDVPAGPEGVYYQNQILMTPLLWPMQLFCFNFGATHIIHHYITNQPFYLRQMIATACQDEMVANGVRKNDFSIVPRANRLDTSASWAGFFKGPKGLFELGNSVYYNKKTA